MTVKEFKDSVKNKKIAVIGIGISNRPLIKYLKDAGAEVTAYDKRTKEQLGEIYDEMCKLGVKTVLGENYLENIEGEIVFKTPGLRFDHPSLIKARENGATVTSEMEMFFEVCPSKIIAVTGSDGKTTTTTLIYEILKKSGYTVWLGGNIGNPLLCDAEKMKKGDIVVLELSSFQLHTMKKSPNVAVITNITPNHLDMHKDYQEYIDAKKNIMRYQKNDDTLIVNAANDVTAKIGKEAKGKLLDFSSKKDAYMSLKDGVILRNGKPVLNVSDIKIPGMHNVENYMAAIAATEGLANDEAILEVAKTFGGVPHRIELIRKLDGVSYYNSSIDSSPNRTINTLKVFDKKVILIAGGKDKNIDYADFFAFVSKRGGVYLIATGENAEKLTRAAFANGFFDTDTARDLKEAVKKAFARNASAILFSPMAASFDRFVDYVARGKAFEEAIKEYETD